MLVSKHVCLYGVTGLYWWAQVQHFTLCSSLYKQDEAGVLTMDEEGGQFRWANYLTRKFPLVKMKFYG